MATIGGLVTVSTLLCVLLLLAVVGFFFWRRRTANSQVKTEANTAGRRFKSWTTGTSVPIPQPSTASPQPSVARPLSPVATDTSLPPHLVLNKGTDLKEKAKKMSENKTALENEFKILVGYVREKVSKERQISSLHKNKPHNRYLDIGTCVHSMT